MPTNNKNNDMFCPAISVSITTTATVAATAISHFPTLEPMKRCHHAVVEGVLLAPRFDRVFFLVDFLATEMSSLSSS